MKKVFISLLVYFRFVLVLSSTYLCKFDLACLFRITIFIKVNDQHCVSFYLLEVVPVTVIKKNCFGKIFAYKKHPNFGGNF